MIAFSSFCTLVFSRSTLTEILENIKYLFSDQDHDMSGMGITGILYHRIGAVYKNFIVYNLVTTIVNLVYIGVLILFKDDRERLKGGMYLCLAVSVFSMIFSDKSFLMNEMFIAFLWTGFESLFYNKNRKYLYLLILSFLFSLGTAIGTTSGETAVSGALCILAVIVLFWTPIEVKSNTTTTINKIAIYSVLLMALFLRVYITWAGKTLSKDDFSYKIVDGPMKGMYTEEVQYKIYSEIYNDIMEMELKKDDVLFVGAWTPTVAYLDAQARVGCMTVYYPLDYNRLNDYYELHPDRVPTAVYYYGYSEEDEKSEFFSELRRGYYMIFHEDRILAKRII